MVETFMSQTDPSVYEKCLEMWPYRYSVDRVFKHVATHARSGAHLLDIMCGPKVLLGRVSEKRPDLQLLGVDIDHSQLLYGDRKYPHIPSEVGNVLNWRSAEKFDVVLCTGALHHVPYDLQEQAIANIARMVRPEGFVVISDCYADPFTSEVQRKKVMAKLGYKYLEFVLEQEAPEEVVRETIQIMEDDVLGREYKVHLAMRIPLLHKYFATIQTDRTWPSN